MSGDVDAAWDALAACLRDPTTSSLAWSRGGCGYEHRRTIEAAIRAQSSGLDVLGDYLTGLEYTLSRMPATGSRYTIAADSRLREAFRLVVEEFARLTEAER